MKNIVKQLLITLALLTVLAQVGAATTVHAKLTTVPFDNGRVSNTWTVFAAPFTDNDRAQLGGRGPELCM